MARHRIDDGPRHGSMLVLALILAVLIAAAGLLAVLLETDTTAPAAVQEESQEQQPIVVTPLPPPVSATALSPEEVLRSCQVKASTSAHPGLDTATCVGDNALGTIVSCVMNPKTCPKPTKGSGMGPNGATAQCTDGTLIYDPNPRTNHTCAIHGGFAKVFD